MLGDEISQCNDYLGKDLLLSAIGHFVIGYSFTFERKHPIRAILAMV